MIYALTDDLGRLVGTIDAPKGSHGVNVEYGGTRDGCLDVAGIGTITKLSNYNLDERLELTELAYYPHYDEAGRKISDAEM